MYKLYNIVNKLIYDINKYIIILAYIPPMTVGFVI